MVIFGAKEDVVDAQKALGEQLVSNKPIEWLDQKCIIQHFMAAHGLVKYICHYSRCIWKLLFWLMIDANLLVTDMYMHI